MRSLNWHSTTLCILISGMFLSFALHTNFVQTLLLWMLGAFAIYTGIRTRKFYFQWYSVFFAALFLLRLIAFFRQPELKFSDIEQSLSFVLFPLIFSLIKIDSKQWQTIQIIVVSGFTLFLSVIFYFYIVNVCLEGFFMQSLANSKTYYTSFLMLPFYCHPSFLAILLASSIPMCFNLAIKMSKPWQQWLCLLYVALLSFIVFAIGSRVGIIVCAVLIILCSLYFFEKLNIVTKVVLLLGIFAALFIFQYSTINYTHDPTRVEMNQFAIEKIKDNPLWGYGYGTQNAYTNDPTNPTAVANPFFFVLDYFHNTYLDEAFQFGLVGVLFLALLLLHIAYVGIKKCNVFIWAFLTIYTLFFYVETPFVIVKGVMPMMLFLAVILNVNKHNFNADLPSLCTTVKRKFSSKSNLNG